MPGKKGKKEKSSKKKGKKSKSVDKGNVEKKEPMAPDYVPLPPWPGQQVVDPAFWETFFISLSLYFRSIPQINPVSSCALFTLTISFVHFSAPACIENEKGWRERTSRIQSFNSSSGEANTQGNKGSQRCLRRFWLSRQGVRILCLVWKSNIVSWKENIILIHRTFIKYVWGICFKNRILNPVWECLLASEQRKNLSSENRQMYSDLHCCKVWKYVGMLNISLHQFRKLGPPEVRKALKALGFKVKRDQVRQLVNDASIKGNGYVCLVKTHRMLLIVEF